MKISELTIMFNHHREPNSLDFILNKWQKAGNQQKIKILICDTGPEDDPIDLDIVRKYPMNIDIFRIDNYLPFNQPTGKNIMVDNCETEWIFMTDPDRFFTKESLDKIFEMELDPSVCYDFDDLWWDPETNTSLGISEHPNTFLITKSLFNQVGGYNEYFSGNYGCDDLDFRLKININRIDVPTYHYHLMDLVERKRNPNINYQKLSDPHRPFIRNSNSHKKIYSSSKMKLTEIQHLFKTDKGTNHDYLEYYDNIFNQKRLDEMNILEIGVLYGESLKLWEYYFPNSKIFGIENFSQLDGGYPYSTPLDYQKTSDNLSKNKRINLINMDCENELSIQEKLDGLFFDIIIDDANHNINQQLKNFINYFPKLNSGGIYVCEDIQEFTTFELLKNTLKINFDGIFNKYECVERKVNIRADDRLFVVWKK